MIGEYSGTNALLRRYVHGPGDDQPLVWYEGALLSDKRYLSADERGSVTSITAQDGSVLALNAYDEYGIPAATNLGRFGYTGQAWLPELGMNYYKARVYSPTLGRFMQSDPIGYASGMNWYNYVGSDPVNATDPSGLIWISETCTGGYQRDLEGGGYVNVARQCTYSSWVFDGGGRGIWDGIGGGIGGGLIDDEETIVVTAGKKRKKLRPGSGVPQSSDCTQSNRGGCQEKKLPKCAQDFLRGRIAGDPGNIRFHRGGSTFNAFGNSVTYGSNIYLAGNSFYRTDAGALTHKFHEIAHTSQNARMGLSALHHGAAYAVFGGHDASPLEQSADDFADETFEAYQKAGLDKTCPF
jgi:RHS repeat-associated protein